ncbi:hypothetical protein EPA93_31970 [Ktedonosporobacter rubrisoli]|uniref:Calcineurin-like phosphoesterase domain-containing protein n=1 Tax=Ktedonosporobacter rubrisoli TaxID=2509675 RepID=A0A4V0YZN5_KTERU|nr:metallophosphoesterase [Ktedonosporobacter rubrisoli]QBD80341.1 hypothetical protein EPA93_31970 [Ktedonosporobacter rubrisoli]
MAEDTVEQDAKQDVSTEQAERHEEVVSIVLTSDNHLGYTAFRQHPRKREELLRRLRRAFQQATDFAIEHKVDLFIQAGDLFDTTTPDERDRSFVATRLAQLKQAGVRAFALGGVHDTPGEAQSLLGEAVLAPQISYARLDALHYFPPAPEEELEPVLLDVRDTKLGICALGVLVGQEGDPLAHLQVKESLKDAAIPLLLLHAPIEGLANGSSLLDTRAMVSQESIAGQTLFRYILAGYHHSHYQLHLGQVDVVVAGATQHLDFSTPDHAPGFVYLGLAADGIQWCKHIPVDTLLLQRLTINTKELWSDDSAAAQQLPTEIILEQLRPLCNADTLLQLRLEGELTRGQYHQLDLNQIRRYGEEHCFALAIDDSVLSLLPEQEAVSAETGERFSPREELIALADEWIADAPDEQEKKALQITKEELLRAMDDMKGKR